MNQSSRCSTWVRRLLSWLLCALPLSLGHAAELHVQGSWGLLLDVSALPGGPGSDLARTYTSHRQVVALSVINTTGHSWTLSVRRSRPDWPAGLALRCRRTGDGLGAYPPRGGLTYLAVTDAPEVLCSGVGDVMGMPLQLEVSGATLRLGPGARDLSLTMRVEEAP